ncbi:helix-turn-helix transcriptional regulator [Marinobacter sp. 71-i]|uniref:Helix-turn-helix transcriptional regulator n=1 Tax=Marinobacter iranensis TaxID=2962607 RepID=A0ABT5YBD8_9GAMM|nr:helix-turn-helix domain-containing protein [Marinobacter iranensis]MDF0750980.1 helix-turn-helix transcriptional regulator [Marinobacter iranensis]
MTINETSISRNGERSAFGHKLRYWRRHRGMSQLDLALEAEISPRHLSFIETGRSRPKRELILKLAETLDIPLRERNELLMAAGLPAAYFEEDYHSSELVVYRKAIHELITNHQPYPALVLNRWGDVVDGNATTYLMFPEFRADNPVNLYQTYLSSPKWKELVVNWDEVAWAAYEHLVSDASRYRGDERMQALILEIQDLLRDTPRPDMMPDSPSIRTRLNMGGEILETTTMIARFGPVNDVFLSELRVEMIFPANEGARRFFSQFAG